MSYTEISAVQAILELIFSIKEENSKKIVMIIKERRKQPLGNTEEIPS